MTVIGVLGASGGVGTSTLATVLTGQLADSLPAVLSGPEGGGVAALAIDLRPASGGLDHLWGIEHRPGVRWSDLHALEGAVDLSSLARQLPTSGRAALLSHGGSLDQPRADQIAALVASAREVGLPVVIDLPGVTEEGHRAAVASVSCVIVLARATVPGFAGAEMAVCGIRDAGVETWLALTAERSAREHGAILAQRLDCPFLGVVPHDKSITADICRGRTPWGQGRLVDVSRRMLRLTTDLTRTIELVPR